MGHPWPGDTSADEILKTAVAGLYGVTASPRRPEAGMPVEHCGAQKYRARVFAGGPHFSALLTSAEGAIDLSPPLMQVA
jgi:hypothetical protein